MACSDGSNFGLRWLPAEKVRVVSATETKLERARS